MNSNSPRDLTGSVLRGLAYVGGQTVVSKLLSLASQYVLSWILLPADFGLVGLAYTVSILSGATMQIGLREFIIRRQRSESWIEPAMAAALVLSIISAALMCACAHFAASAYHEPRVAGLIFVLAVAQPFSALNVILSAVLQKRLSFGTLAGIGVLNTLLSALFTVSFAELGFGAYSFVAPIPLLGALQFLALLRLCGQHFKWRPRPRLWRHFMTTGAYVLITSALMTLGSQGDYILLGHFHPASEVGIYFFAFNLSVQVTALLWAGFGSVLFPLMSTIQDDPQRLSQAFRKTVGTIAVLVVPFCVLQASLAGPLIKLFFAAKWLPAIPLIQLMSVGIGLHTIAEPCVPLLQAQGRFKDLLNYTLVWNVLLLPCIYVAAKYGNALSVSGTVAAFYAIASPVYFFFVVRRFRARIRDVLAIYLPPACASLLSGSAVMAMSAALHLGPTPSILLGVPVFFASYFFLISVLAPIMLRNAVGLIRSQVSWLR